MIYIPNLRVLPQLLRAIARSFIQKDSPLVSTSFRSGCFSSTRPRHSGFIRRASECRPRKFKSRYYRTDSTAAAAFTRPSDSGAQWRAGGYGLERWSVRVRYINAEPSVSKSTDLSRPEYSPLCSPRRYQRLLSRYPPAP